MRALAPRTVLLALVAACNKSTEAPPPPLPGQIAFVSDRGRFGQIDIFVMTANGGAMMDLTDVLSKDEWPAWSKDGSKLAFQSDRSANAMVALDIFVSDADGMNVVQLTSDTAQDGEPSWSPDGTQIAFVSNRDSLFHIYVMNAADGSGVTRLTSGLQTDAQPVWSPDGSKIAFATNRDVNDEIYVMDADGSSPVNLTKNGAYDDAPAWSPEASPSTAASTSGSPGRTGRRHGRSRAATSSTTFRAGVPDPRQGSLGPERVQMTIVPQTLSLPRNCCGVSLSERYTSIPTMPTAAMSGLVELLAGKPSTT